MQVTEMTGRRVGRLSVIGRAPGRGGVKQALWHCRCDCGVETTVYGSNLRRGSTRSCGCLIVEMSQARLRTHGMSKTGGRKGHPLYEIWLGIRRRCMSPSMHAYARYGGRGIQVTPEWSSFAVFVRDVGPRPSSAHSLDRIDNDGDYEPGNVRWATAREQAANRGPAARLGRENAALVAEVERLDAENVRLTVQFAAVYELHTDSVMGPCPVCYRSADVSDTDDGLVAWPCPTLRAMGVSHVR